MSNLSNSSVVIPAVSSTFQPASSVEVALRTTQAILISILNLFILLVFYRIKKWTFSNLLFISLSISDLMAGCIALPLAIVSTEFAVWPIGGFMCVVYQILKFAQMRVSNQTVVVLSLHRCIQLFNPFHAEERMNWKSITALAFCWVFPFGYSMIMVLVLYLTNNFKIPTCALITPPLYLGIYIVIIDIIPSLVSVSVNIYNIYGLYSRYQKTAIPPTQSNPQVPQVKPTHLESSANDSNINSQQAIRHSKNDSNKQAGTYHKIVKTRRDLKAAVCISAIILNVVMSEYPLFITGIVYAFNSTSYYMSVFLWAIKVIYFFPLLNPIILFVFNPNFQAQSLETIKMIRDSLKKVITCKCF